MFSLIATSFIALMALVGIASPTEAAIIEATHDPETGIDFISVIGRIDIEDGKKFAQTALVYEKAVVILDGPGGSLLAGLEIGKAIRLKEFSTIVASGSECASACGFAWLGGIRRFLLPGAKIGFHAAYSERYGEVKESGQGNAIAGAYLNQLGLSQSAIAYITQAAPDSMTWLTPDDARRLGIEATFLEPNSSPGPSVSPGNSTTSPATPSEGQDAFKRLSDADIFGYDLESGMIDSPTVERCELACASNPNCRAYTFNTRNLKCFLKSGGSRVLGHGNAMAGYRTDLEASLRVSSITIFERTDFPGNDFSASSGGTLEQCIAECEANSRCAGFTYIHRHKQCWLKSRIGSSTQKRTALSGVKRDD